MPFGQFTIPGFNPYAPMIQIPAGGDPGVSGMPAAAPPAPAPRGRFQGLLSALAGPGDPSMDPAAQQALNNQFLLNLGGGLLAGSRSGQGFGGIFGNALQGAQQAKQQSIDSQLQRVLLKAKLKQAQQKESRIGTFNPGDYTTESVAKFEQTGNPADLVRYVAPSRAQQDNGIGNVNPGDFTPESVQQYLQTRTPENPLGDFSVLKRYVTPSNPSVQILGGVPTSVQPTRGGGPITTTPLSTIESEEEAKRRLAEAAATGSGRGQVESDREAKAPAVASMDYVLKEFENQLGSTDQGMISGRLGSVIDYDDSRRFDNLREQLSTEVRTVYRIPGEGTLTNQEQQQYGIQLPDRKNSKEVNQKIINDLRNRTSLRLEQPANGRGASGSFGAPARKYNPATGRIE